MAKKRIGPKTQKIMLEKNKKIGRVFNVLFLSACAVAGILFVYFAAYPEIYKRAKQYMRIDGYTAIGIQNLDSAEIANSINIDENSNFFNVSTYSIASKIEKIQGIENVKVVKKPFSNSLEIKITQRTPSFLVNIDNELYWSDKNGYLWKNPKLSSDEDYCLVVGLEFHKDSLGKKIPQKNIELFEKTYSAIRGKNKNSNNIKTISFNKNDIVEFAASDISVPVRLNGTLKYGTDDLVKFEDILRKDGKAPLNYLDVYENAIFAK